MAKLSKDEILAKISDKVTDENVAIELLEDITDSFDSESEDTKEIEKLREENADLKRKYKERFLSSDKKEDKKEDEEELEEKEVIDVKEI